MSNTGPFEGSGASQRSGHEYQGFTISGSAKVQNGDNYYHYHNTAGQSLSPNSIGARIKSTDLQFGDYTVAWIAPLPIEYEAACYMLDEEHEGTFKSQRGDDYVYTAGEINGHNVIIATFPADQDYGVGSAAALASQVKKSFPNLWFGLLVGVAAGLPDLSRDPPRDIRLGDVLVGMGDHGKAGLVSYGLGKETSDGFVLLHPGMEAKSESVVRSVIGQIDAQTPRKGNVFLKYFESMKDQPHRTGNFCDPGQDKDQLFESFVESGRVVTTLVNREARPANKRTKVWYGSIGSGDRLMKNAQERNKLRDKFDLIGLEMEAAGIMNTIPVGVVRGVCDYGDEQKNKIWQPYAAAIAAAYANEILHRISPLSNSRRDRLNAQMTAGPDIATPSQRADVYYMIEDGLQVIRFVGRESELSVLETRCQAPIGTSIPPPKVIVIQGMGGQGKTQLALEFCRRSRSVFRGIFWINASSPEIIGPRFQTLARKLEPTRNFDNLDASRDFVKNCLASWDELWMIVFDNYDDIHSFDIRRYFPTHGNGVVLITSRHEGTTKLDSEPSLHLRSMSEEDGIELLLRNPDDREKCRAEASNIIKRLGGLALAIAQAAAYIEFNQLPISEFLPEYDSKRRKILEFTPDEFWDYHRIQPDSIERRAALSAFTTWEMSFEKIIGSKSYGKEAAQRFEDIGEFLTVCSFLDPSKISEYIFSHPCTRLINPPRWSRVFMAFNGLEEPEHEPQNQSQEPPEVDIDSGQDRHDRNPRFKLTKGNTGGAPKLNLLLRGSAKERRSSMTSEAHGKKTKMTLLATWNSSAYFGEMANLSKLSLLQEATRIKYDTKDTETIISLHPLIRDWLQLRGKAEQSTLKYLEEVRNMLSEIVSEGVNPRYRNEVILHVDTYILNDARIQVSKSTLGFGSEMCHANIFGYFYLEQGRYGFAERLFQKSFELQQKELGLQHPSTLDTMLMLGMTLSTMGKHSQAETIQRRNVELYNNLRGREDENLLISISNLAATLARQGKYQEAEVIFRENLALQNQFLGAENANTPIGIDTVDVTLKKQEARPQRENLQPEVLRLGKFSILDSFNLSRLMHNLALTLDEQAKYDEAETIYREAINLKLETLRDDYPQTLMTNYNLADMLMDQDRNIESEEILSKFTVLLTKVVDHLGILNSLNCLAVTIRNQHRFDEAEILFRKVLDFNIKVLGPDHPATLNCMCSLAENLRRQEKNSEAEEMYRKALDLNVKVNGKEDPKTLMVMNKFALFLDEQDRDVETENIFREALDLKIKVLGERHESTIIGMRNLAGSLRKQHKNNEAEEMYRKVLDLEEKELGQGHNRTVTTMNQIADSLVSQNKFDEAEAMLRKALDRSKALGEKLQSLTLLILNKLVILLKFRDEDDEVKGLRRQIAELEETTELEEGNINEGGRSAQITDD